MDQGFLPEVLAQVIRWLAVQSPLLLAWVAGIVFAIARWRRHPTVSLLTIAGLATLLLSVVLGVFLNAWRNRLLAADG